MEEKKFEIKTIERKEEKLFVNGIEIEGINCVGFGSEIGASGIAIITIEAEIPDGIVKVESRGKE